MTSVSEIAHSLGLLDIPDGVLIRPQDVMDCPAPQGRRSDFRHAGRAHVGAFARGCG